MKVELISSPPQDLYNLENKMSTMGFIPPFCGHFYYTFVITNVSKYTVYDMMKLEVFKIQENKNTIQYHKGFSYTVPKTCKDIEFKWLTIDPKTEETLSSIKVTFDKAIDYIRNMYFTFIKHHAKGADIMLPQAVHTQILATIEISKLYLFFLEVFNKESYYHKEELIDLAKILLTICIKCHPTTFLSFKKYLN